MRYDHNLITRLINSGLTAKQISSVLGCHPNTVWKIRAEMGAADRMTLEDVERSIYLLSARLTDNIKRAKHPEQYYELMAKKVVAMEWDEYQYLRMLRRQKLDEKEKK
jgi:hypothetical protein